MTYLTELLVQGKKVCSIFEKYSCRWADSFLYTTIQGLFSFQFILFVLPLSLSHFDFVFYLYKLLLFSALDSAAWRFVYSALFAVVVAVFPSIRLNIYAFIHIFSAFVSLSHQFLVVVALLLTPWYPFCLPPALRLPLLELELEFELLAKSTSVSATGGPQETCRRTVAGPATGPEPAAAAPAPADDAPPGPPLPPDPGLRRLELAPLCGSCRCCCNGCCCCCCF